jgi:hypothetical protein
MTLSRIRLRISTPREPIPPGGGFYQLEEDILYVQVGLFSTNRRFFSYLESENVRLELDRSGHLIFIEVNLPRRRWEIDTELAAPVIVEPADIRWLNFRNTFKEPRLVASPDKTTAAILFSDLTPTHNYYLAESVILQTYHRREAVAIVVKDIVDDLAGKEIASFRKSLREKTVAQEISPRTRIFS